MGPSALAMTPRQVEARRAIRNTFYCTDNGLEIDAIAQFALDDLLRQPAGRDHFNAGANVPGRDLAPLTYLVATPAPPMSADGRSPVQASARS